MKSKQETNGSYAGLPFLRRIQFKRPLTSYSRVRLLIGSLIRNRTLQFTSRLRKLEYLNSGCGSHFVDRFVNLDYQWMPGLDLCWDVRRPLPFSDATMQGIFTEHCLEHLHLEECKAALREFKRILKPGGVIRIVVPDAEMYFELYSRYKRGEDVRFPYEPDPHPSTYTPLMLMNTNLLWSEHLYVYDAETFTAVLNELGFKDIRKEKYLSGRDTMLLLDDLHRSVESLYIEAAVQ